VACVPRARDWATSATARHHGGTVTFWAGVIGVFAAVAAGSLITFSDLHSNDRVVGGLALMSGGALLGLSAMVTGQFLRMGGTARGIDAINLYNDHILSGTRCPP
jgi:hypothetical protein